ncbi:MAG TPA: site-specific DNA-methyltransferase, partial [Candidatus Tectomicrobia bacterium]
MATRGRRSNLAAGLQEAEAYRHPEAESLLRPDVGTQPQFRKKKPPVTYRYDSSLSPTLAWDGQNPVRELGEWLIGLIERAAALPPPHVFDNPHEFKRSDGKIVATVRNLQDAVAQLTKISRSFLNWAGKAERLSFDVPTLPLFVHERLSTKGIIETLQGHRKDKGAEQLTMAELFGDPQRPVIDQVLKAYEYRDKWVNRMILGDSLAVMNSLLHYEGLGGQVQMIYMDPPYGVKFGSNFQPFIRKRDVNHNDDEDMTREPEMVKAYRDTWEVGVHSYLTYLRDRLLLCRELLHSSGSIFVQISDENMHHVREVMEEVFEAKNFVGIIPFLTTSSQTAEGIGSVADYLVWFAKNKEQIKYHQLYVPKDPRATGGWGFNYIEEKNRTRRPLTKEERRGEVVLPADGCPYQLDNITSQGTTPTGTAEFVFNGKKYHPGPRSHWKTTIAGMEALANARRIQESSNQIRYVRFFDDFPVQPLTNLWTDTTQAGFVDAKLYAVQTVAKVIERCILMTTEPGDLVLDPTCGSGTTAYVAEQWGRRWITIDTSRVPLALARQRLLTATFPYYQLKDEP